ncbi:hypothetical protein P3S68_012510 [Capsicum galapagoense]
MSDHSSSSTTATINLMNSKKIHRNSRTSPSSSSRDTRTQFEASEHAVPSGPNPSSN